MKLTTNRYWIIKAAAMIIMGVVSAIIISHVELSATASFLIILALSTVIGFVLRSFRG